jgi:hypothetical protein
MINNFTLFTTAKISQEEYQNILKHIGAVALPESVSTAYDARLSRETRHLRMCLMTGELFDLALMESSDDEINEITRLLGGKPATAIQLDLSDHRASLNILADVVPYIGQHYRSVVADETGEIRQPEDFVRLAQPGYDGYFWNQKHQRMMKGETLVENVISE